MDKIIIERLTVPALIGVFEQERQQKQLIVIDLQLGFDARPAAGSDNIEHTINYKTVCTSISDYIAQTEYQLVETLAESLAAQLMQQFRALWLRLRVLKKPFDLPDVEHVGIEIERSA